MCSDPLLKSGLSGFSVQPPQPSTHNASAFIADGVNDNGLFMNVSESRAVPADHEVAHFSAHADAEAGFGVHNGASTQFKFKKQKFAQDLPHSPRTSLYTQEDDNVQPSMQLLIWGCKSKLAKPLPLSLIRMKAA